MANSAPTPAANSKYAMHVWPQALHMLPLLGTTRQRITSPLATAPQLHGLPSTSCCELGQQQVTLAASLGSLRLKEVWRHPQKQTQKTGSAPSCKRGWVGVIDLHHPAAQQQRPCVTSLCLQVQTPPSSAPTEG
jgi:hypothetical protein